MQTESTPPQGPTAHRYSARAAADASSNPSTGTHGLRVVFVSYTFQPEPGVVRGLPLAKWLRERGYDVKVLTGFPQYPIGRIYPGYEMSPAQWENMEGVPVLRTPLYPSHDQSAIKRMLTYFTFTLSASTIGASKIGPADVVFYFDNTPTSGIVAWVLKKLHGAAIVKHIADLWPDSVIESGMIRNPFLAERAERILFRWFDRLYKQSAIITVLSPGFKRVLASRGVPEKKLRVVYNWADESLFKPLPRDPRLAAELGLEGKCNFVYAGNVGPLQALDAVVRAAALVKDHPRVQVVIIGTGPHLEAVQTVARNSGATNVRFYSRRPLEEMPAINAVSDVLLVHLRDVPFLRTTIPSKVQVSLASGRPVLAGLEGDAAEILRQAQAGIVCTPENVEELAAAMVRMAEMAPEDLDAMGQRGFRYYMENLSLDIGGRQMDEIFREAAASRRR